MYYVHRKERHMMRAKVLKECEKMKLLLVKLGK